jgi:hypothetical protein
MGADDEIDDAIKEIAKHIDILATKIEFIPESSRKRQLRSTLAALQATLDQLNSQRGIAE